MTSRWLPLILLAGAALLSPAVSAAQGTDGLDAFWDEMSRTVAEGDFDGYAALYHPDAVLVTLDPGSSVPIAQALAGWAPGFADTREGWAAAQRRGCSGTSSTPGVGSPPRPPSTSRRCWCRWTVGGGW